MNDPSQMLDQRYGMLKSISKQMYLAKRGEFDADPVMLQKAAMDWAMDDQKIDIWYNLNRGKFTKLSQDERLDNQEKQIFKWGILRQSDDPIFIPQGQKGMTPLQKGLEMLQTARQINTMKLSPEESATVKRGAGVPVGENAEDEELKLYDTESDFNKRFVEVKGKGVKIGEKQFAKVDPRSGTPTNMTESDRVDAEKMLRIIELRRNKVTRLKGEQTQGEIENQQKQKIALDAPPTPELGSVWDKLNDNQKAMSYQAYQMGLSPSMILAAIQKELGAVENPALEKTKELAGKEKEIEIPDTLKPIYEKATPEQKARLLESMRTGKGKKAIIAEIGG
jgi:hypothetical protein